MLQSQGRLYMRLCVLYGALIIVVNAECVAHSINQASFKPAGFVTGDPITGEKSHSRHSHSMSSALMHCGNLLTIQFQTQTPAVYTVPQPLPSPHCFTFIRPHTSIKGGTEGSGSSISCQKCASEVWGSERSSDGEKEEPRASPSITILREFSWSRKAENDHFVWVHTGVQVYITHIYVRVCVWVCVHVYNGRTK